MEKINQMKFQKASVMEDKHALRQHFILNRKNLTFSEKAVIHRKIISNLISDEGFINASNIFIYSSTDEEIPTDQIIIEAFKMGKRVFVPKCISKGIMEACEIKSLSELEAGKFGIREPVSNNFTDKTLIELSIVPCLASDKDGYRLGYGGGYYDRFLQNLTSNKIALCYNKHCIASLPHDEYDVKCDKIITERQVK